MTLNNLLYTDQILPDTELMLLVSLDSAITEATGVSFDKIESKSRYADVVEARHIYLTFLRFSGLSLSQTVQTSGYKFETIRYASRRMKMLYGQRFEKHLKDKINHVSELTGIEILF